MSYPSREDGNESAAHTTRGDNSHLNENVYLRHYSPQMRKGWTPDLVRVGDWKERRKKQRDDIFCRLMQMSPPICTAVIAARSDVTDHAASQGMKSSREKNDEFMITVLPLSCVFFYIIEYNHITQSCLVDIALSRIHLFGILLSPLDESN